MPETKEWSGMVNKSRTESNASDCASKCRGQNLNSALWLRPPLNKLIKPTNPQGVEPQGAIQPLAPPLRCLA